MEVEAQKDFAACVLGFEHLTGLRVVTIGFKISWLLAKIGMRCQSQALQLKLRFAWFTLEEFESLIRQVRTS